MNKFKSIFVKGAKINKVLLSMNTQ